MHISSISQVQQAVLCAFQQHRCSRPILNLSSTILSIDIDKQSNVDKKNSVQKTISSTRCLPHGSHAQDPLLWKIHTHGSLASPVLIDYSVKFPWTHLEKIFIDVIIYVNEIFSHFNTETYQKVLLIFPRKRCQYWLIPLWPVISNKFYWTELGKISSDKLHGLL